MENGKSSVMAIKRELKPSTEYKPKKKQKRWGTEKKKREDDVYWKTNWN